MPLAHTVVSPPIAEVRLRINLKSQVIDRVMAYDFANRRSGTPSSLLNASRPECTGNGYCQREKVCTVKNGCQYGCVCNKGWNGDDCSVSDEEMAQRQAIRSSLLQAVVNSTEAIVSTSPCAQYLQLLARIKASTVSPAPTGPHG